MLMAVAVDVLTVLGLRIDGIVAGLVGGGIGLAVMQLRWMVWRRRHPLITGSSRARRRMLMRIPRSSTVSGQRRFSIPASSFGQKTEKSSTWWLAQAHRQLVGAVNALTEIHRVLGAGEWDIYPEVRRAVQIAEHVLANVPAPP